MSRIPKPEDFKAATKSPASRAAAVEYDAYYSAETNPVGSVRAERTLSALDLMYAYYDAA